MDNYYRYYKKQLKIYPSHIHYTFMQFWQPPYIGYVSIKNREINIKTKTYTSCI